MKDLETRLNKIEKYKNEIFTSTLANQKFVEECEQIYLGILKEVLNISKNVLDKNSVSDKYYVFEINNVGSVHFAVYKEDSLTLIVQRVYDSKLNVKRDFYQNKSSQFDDYSIKVFIEAIQKIKEIQINLSKTYK